MDEKSAGIAYTMLQPMFLSTLLRLRYITNDIKLRGT